MSTQVLVDQDTWLKARKQLLEEEKAFTQARDKLSAARRQLPLVQVNTNYVFDTEDGPSDLLGLFKGKSQLIVYHFMFGAQAKEGCPICSFWMDNISGICEHLGARDTNFLCASTAPLDRLLAYRERMGWQFDWVSSGRCRFNADFGVTFKDRQPAGPTGGYNYKDRVFGEEMPGLSVFLKLPDGKVGHAYSTYSRGLDIINGAYNLLDLTPLGRQEHEGQPTMQWVKRKDQYE